MKPTFILTALFLFINSLSAQNATIWNIDNLNSIGGYAIMVTGEPKIVQSDLGNALEFHSASSDRIQIPSFPLANAQEFTIEVIFKPYAMDSLAGPRFFHICKNGGTDKNTITLETRYNSRGWYADYYIRQVSDKGYINPALTHPIDQWAHIALVYRNNSFKGYTNGNEENSAAGNTDSLLPGANAEISLGGRMNNVNYFDGIILKVIFTPAALTPDKFTLPK
ncbi:MAG: LamG domain-containing protein [Paludibacter sp.]|jgi:hypothetical protein|nr:LamG domain-containing protein [Paludibacter sp.]